MTTAAIMMMIVAMLTVWGGLLVAVVWAFTHPEEPEEADAQ